MIMRSFTLDYTTIYDSIKSLLYKNKGDIQGLGMGIPLQ